MSAQEGHQEEREQDYRKVVATIGIILLLLLFACLLWWLLSQRGEVPDVVGMKMDDARAAIAKAGFVLGDITTQTALPGEDGTIIDQSPEGGRHAFKGSDIEIVLAQRLRAGRTGGVETDVGGAPVIESGPAVFTPFVGTGVEAADVPFSAPSSDTGPRVPSVLGMTLPAARTALSAAGYRCSVKYGPVSTIAPPGQVYFQDPAPDTVVARGSLVTIWIATAESPTGYTLPTD